ncbi:MAG: M42 family metallopeptidase [Clostridia bacterium]|nr:M42 family metallopeptidase [Clostridia bacterium]
MELLKKLTHITAVSGNEESIFSNIVSELGDYADEIYTDSLNNIIVHKKGDGKKLMFSAHTDEIGIMANYIDDKGFIRFATIGGVDLYTSLYQRVVFQNGTIGTVCFENKTDIKKDLKIQNMYIDIGASSKAEALNLVKPGDTASFVGDFCEREETVVSKALDNRAGVYILCEAIKRIKNSPFDLYFVFSSQEEIGLRGARTAAYNIEPDVAIAVDVTATGDTPECETLDISLGLGAAIKIMDKSVICNKNVRESLEKCAKENNIAYQFEILTYGGTDAGAMQTVKSGAMTGAISLPLRYVHTPCETANKKDIEACIKLVSEFCIKDFILS